MIHLEYLRIHYGRIGQYQDMGIAGPRGAVLLTTRSNIINDILLYSILLRYILNIAIFLLNHAKNTTVLFKDIYLNCVMTFIRVYLNR